MRFEVSQHWLTRQWRWRLVAANHRTVATAGESYHNLKDCLNAVDIVKRSAGTPIKIKGA